MEREALSRKPVTESHLEVGVLEIERVIRVNIENFLRMPTLPIVLFRTDKNENGELVDNSLSSEKVKLVAPKGVLTQTVIKVLEETVGLDQKSPKVVRRTIQNEGDQRLFKLPIGTVLEYRTYKLEGGNLVKRVSAVRGEGEEMLSDEWVLQREVKFILGSDALTPQKAGFTSARFSKLV